MDIDDLLGRKEFKELDNFLNEEMLKAAGDYLVGMMLELFVDQSSARNWFYSNNEALGGCRPYDYCKKGKGDEIEAIIGRIEHGIYS